MDTRQNPDFRSIKGRQVFLDFQTWGRTAGSVGAPTSGFGGMAVRSSGLGEAPSAGFWGLGQSRIQVLEVMKDRTSLGAPPCFRHCRVKERDNGVFWSPHPSKSDLVRPRREEIASLYKLLRV